jgi:zinc transporter ZupT
MINILLLKGIFAICIFLADFIGGILPIFFIKYFISYKLLDYFNAIGGGILFGVSLLQMLSAAESNPSIDTNGIDIGFPIVHFISAIGFFFTFFIQWCMGFMKKRNNTKNGFNNLVEEEELQFRERSVTIEMQQFKEGLPDQTIISPTSFILLIVLIIESILTGITIGIQDIPSTIYILFFAVISHDWIESMVLTLSFFETSLDMTSKKTLILISFSFSISTSIGIVIGCFILSFMHIYTVQLLASGFLSFASGTFLYISTIDMIKKSIDLTNFSFKSFYLSFIGFGFSAVTMYFIR